MLVQLLRALFWCHFVPFDYLWCICIYWLMSFMHHYFGGVDTLITYSWVMVVSSLWYCIPYSLLFLYIILGTTSRFVGIAYHIVQLCMYGSFILFQLPFICFLYGVENGVEYTDTYMYYWWKGLARSSAMAYLYVSDGCFIFRRLVPILGRGSWLSVK